MFNSTTCLLCSSLVVYSNIHNKSLADGEQHAWRMAYLKVFQSNENGLNAWYPMYFAHVINSCRHLASTTILITHPTNNNEQQ